MRSIFGFQTNNPCDAAAYDMCIIEELGLFSCGEARKEQKIKRVKNGDFSDFVDEPPQPNKQTATFRKIHR